MFWVSLVVERRCFHNPTSRVAKGSLLQPLLVTFGVPFVLVSYCFCVLWVTKGSLLQPDVASRDACGSLLQPLFVTLRVPLPNVASRVAKDSLLHPLLVNLLVKLA